MSTRALYTFKGETAADTWNVYKHHDGYPTGAASVLQQAIDWFAWVLPRYEADAFACAFIAAGKAHYLIDHALAKKAKDRKHYAEHYFPGKDYRRSDGGGLRMMPQGDPLAVACTNCADIQYRYEISQGNDGELRIRAYSVSAWDAPGSEELLVDCKLSKFATWAKNEEARQNAA